MSASDFIDESKWIEGPKFLHKPEDKWPREEQSPRFKFFLPEEKNKKVNTQVIKEESGRQTSYHVVLSKDCCGHCLRYKKSLKT